MSEYLLCISRPGQGGAVEVVTSRNDPRQQTADIIQLLRGLGPHSIEWTLPVVNSQLSVAALEKALRKHRVRGRGKGFRCDPMTARGEAIKLTTLRPPTKARRKPGLLRRLIGAA